MLSKSNIPVVDTLKIFKSLNIAVCFIVPTNQKSIQLLGISEGMAPKIVQKNSLEPHSPSKMRKTSNMFVLQRFFVTAVS